MKYDLQLTEEQRAQILNDCGVFADKIIKLIIQQDQFKHSDCIEDEGVVAIDVMQMPIAVGLFDKYMEGVRRVVEEQNAEMLCKADNTAELIDEIVRLKQQLPLYCTMRKQYYIHDEDKEHEENEGYQYFYKYILHFLI